MVTMPGRGTLGSKGDDDIGLISPQKVDDLSDESVGIDVPQNAVAVAGRRKRRNAENARRCPELRSTTRRQIRARRDGDAGSLAGIPVGSAEEVDPIARGRDLRQCAAHRERFVVRMRENAC
jgi:hypothetical protein